ncbi:SGNH/GDSL hydrolase family protein [Nocardioides panacis]|uniref:SGNH/GDSL hydrolase family protein n=1 Tax=Nocardioides panacis TaxID=2849501 RepID=A0A975T1N5_9ACTN|nr:SGNH/GDSL hydrolase family protein [Nocardioides panacis]QWZ09959.1 SGNH/GDSL hydrolase family protein [Nocardioides panacis]
MVLFALVGAAPVRDAEAAGQRGRPTPHVVLALGDSVPAGTACGCRAFPREYGALLGRHTGASVTVDNAAVSGLGTNGLLAQLRQPRVVAAARRTDVFLLTIGANDFGAQHDRVVHGACAVNTASDCVRDRLASMRAHLATILAQIRTLRAGHPTTVLVTGYWNVFEDGTVAQHAAGAAGLRASIGLTRRVNRTISSVSRSAGARYVDIFAPFQRHGVDIDSLLAPDGDHPDAAGHRLIAAELLRAGLPRLR